VTGRRAERIRYCGRWTGVLALQNNNCKSAPLTSKVLVDRFSADSISPREIGLRDGRVRSFGYGDGRASRSELSG